MRRIYTHLNNTNPLLDAASPESTEITAAGAEVVPDGTAFIL
jgi:pyrroloquinoline quinone biosynthesis protein B